MIRDVTFQARHRLFGPLRLLLAQAEAAYRAYLPGKLYLHALNIRKANTRIIGLLQHEAVFLPADLVPDAAALTNHYEAWLSQFEQHEQSTRPRLDSAFVFDACDPSARFPSSSVARLLSYAATLDAQSSETGMGE